VKQGHSSHILDFLWCISIGITGTNNNWLQRCTKKSPLLILPLIQHEHGSCHFSSVTITIITVTIITTNNKIDAIVQQISSVVHLTFHHLLQSQSMS